MLKNSYSIHLFPTREGGVKARVTWGKDNIEYTCEYFGQEEYSVFVPRDLSEDITYIIDKAEDEVVLDN